jgi:hypothetical protein
MACKRNGIAKISVCGEKAMAWRRRAARGEAGGGIGVAARRRNQTVGENRQKKNKNEK